MVITFIFLILKDLDDRQAAQVMLSLLIAFENNYCSYSTLAVYLIVRFAQPVLSLLRIIKPMIVTDIGTIHKTLHQVPCPCPFLF